MKLPVTKFGCYNPWARMGGVLTSIGIGLMSTFTIHSPARTWIGYQILAGAGRGMMMQIVPFPSPTKK
jgi:hypothetical protein